MFSIIHIENSEFSELSRYFRCALLFAFFALVCVPARSAPEINYWNVDKLLSVDAEDLELSDGRGGTFGTLTRERLLLLNEVRRRLEKSAGIRTDLYFATSEQSYIFSNQMATGRNLVCITLPMLAEIGNDVDVLAALLGHELGHLKLGHERLRLQDLRRRYEQTLGMVKDQFVNQVNAGSKSGDTRACESGHCDNAQSDPYHMVGMHTAALGLLRHQPAELRP